jgi:hypothetical protein
MLVIDRRANNVAASNRSIFVYMFVAVLIICIIDFGFFSSSSSIDSEYYVSRLTQNAWDVVFFSLWNRISGTYYSISGERSPSATGKSHFGQIVHAVNNNVHSINKKISKC